MKVDIIQRDPVNVLAIRHVGPYHEIGPAFDSLMGYVTRHHVPMNEVIGMYHDDPGVTPPEELRSDACMVVHADFELGDTEGLPVRVDTVPGGEFARTTHMGSYEGLPGAWQWFMTEGASMVNRGMEGACFEIYVNDCTQVPEAEVRTDLYQALAPA